MEIQYFGANCVKISTKQASVIVDDNLAELGLKSITKKGDIGLFTGAHGEPSVETKLIIDQPGEYEVSNVSIDGYSARAHMDEEDKRTATAYKITADDIRIFVPGHIYPELDDEQLEDIGLIEVLIVPVGGNGYTLDPIGAYKLIKQIDPKVIIPVHYNDKAVKYPVEQQDLESALKVFGMEAKEHTEKLKFKGFDFNQGTQLIVLERQ